MSKVTSSIDQIMEDIDAFLGKRFRARKKGILIALKSIADPQTSFDAKVEAAGETLQEFWKEYSREHVAKVLEGFPKIQKALFGLELEPELGERYRDHFLHMFNIFVFGARILSKVIIADRSGKLLKKLFKVTEEPKKVGKLFRKGEYTAAERLNFLWTLMSTFHDVGIPIQHLPNLQRGLNLFLDHFGLRISEFSVEREASVDCRLPYYFELMARMYNDGITLEREGEYRKTIKPHPYVQKALLDEYSRNSHGAISAICLYKSIEETFYRGKKEEKRLDLDLHEIKTYNDLVFEEDITRVALVIALHDINVETYPKLFPISFRKFPFLFILIFCDEFQEYFRLEGSSLTGVTLIKSFPFLDVKMESRSGKIEIHTKILYAKPTTAEEETIKREVLPYYRKIGETPPNNFEEHIARVWKRIVERLEKKLSFKGEPIKIIMDVYQAAHGSEVCVMHWESGKAGW